MHILARKFQLKSRSYGKGDARHAILTKPDPSERGGVCAPRAARARGDVCECRKPQARVLSPCRG